MNGSGRDNEGRILLGTWRDGAPAILLSDSVSLHQAGAAQRLVSIPVDAPTGAWVAWRGSTASPTDVLAARLPMCWYRRSLRQDGEVDHDVHWVRGHAGGLCWQPLPREPLAATLVDTLLRDEAWLAAYRPAGPGIRRDEAADLVDLILGLHAVRGALREPSGKSVL